VYGTIHMVTGAACHVSITPRSRITFVPLSCHHPRTLAQSQRQPQQTRLRYYTSSIIIHLTSRGVLHLSIKPDLMVATAEVIRVIPHKRRRTPIARRDIDAVLVALPQQHPADTPLDEFILESGSRRDGQVPVVPQRIDVRVVDRAERESIIGVPVAELGDIARDEDVVAVDGFLLYGEVERDG